MASVIKAGNATDGVQVTSDNTGILELKTGTGSGTTAMTVGTGQNVTFAQAANLPNTFGFKNRIINGDMRIDQRNAGAAVNTNGTYPVDRFLQLMSGGGVLTSQRSTTAPTGFINSIFTQVTTADASIAAGDYYLLRHVIEGFNVADLGWGAAGAQSVTLSFQVRSSVTGTFSGSLTNSAEDRSYPFTYSISSANTWTSISVTIPGDTSGTWLKDNGVGIRVNFDLGTGSTRLGTANAWGSSVYFGVTGSVQLISTLNATFYITGVQLEKGSTATSFDYRPYGTELQLCQRYLPAFNSTGTTATVCSAFANSSTKARATFPFPVSARSAATGVTVSAGSHFTFTGTTTVAGTSVAFHTGSATAASFDLDGVSGLTAGQGGLIYCTNSTGYLLFTGCEL